MMTYHVDYKKKDLELNYLRYEFKKPDIIKYHWMN